MKEIKVTGSSILALVDDVDFDNIAQWSWCINGCKYPYRRETISPKKTRKLYMHRAIIGDNGQLHIDHINRNPFDNRRENLRWVTRYQNLQNMIKSVKNKTGFKGVTKATSGLGYYSRIRYNGKEINLGYYRNPEDAHKAYLEAVVKYHKEYAPR